MALLEVEELRTFFHTRNGVVRAVDGVSFAVESGETVGIVGESGSGKSVTAYSLLGLIDSPPGKVEARRVVFNGVDLSALPQGQRRGIRGKDMAIVFQDPMTALNPYMTVGEQLMEPLVVHERMPRRTAFGRAVTALEEVGIHDGAKRMRAYPHEFSGGMRQRVMIAMALITRPSLLLADEPTTALDVTVQTQILELIRSMQRQLGMAVVLITHNLGVVAGMCDRVLVMYAGGIVEAATTTDLFATPRHPYTKALLASVPSVDTCGRSLYSIPGTPPDLSAESSGCAFAPRCQYATERCVRERMELREVAPGHFTSCVRVQSGEL